MIIRVLGAVVTVIAFSGLVGVPKKYLIYNGIVGGVGWFLYLTAMAYIGVGTVGASFAAAIGVAFLSHIFARIFHAPVTVFLIGGILPLVPGAGMYRIAFHIMDANSQMAGFYARETLQIAGMLALGIFTMDSVFKVIQLKKWKN